MHIETTAEKLRRLEAIDSLFAALRDGSAKKMFGHIKPEHIEAALSRPVMIVDNSNLGKGRR
jgi:hypothetical protein